MMKARFLRSSALEDLRSSIADNLPAYRAGSFAHLVIDGSHWFELGVDIDYELLCTLKAPNGQELHEAENCSITHRAMGEISPYEARDERLWAYLAHGVLLEYARQRWPIPANDEEAFAHIRKHFFARDKRQVERDNAVSRLWWMAHLCARVPSLSLEEALQAFLFRTDVRANIIERPTSSQSVDLFGAILAKLSISLTGSKKLFERPVFRQLMREINSVGG